VAFEAEDAAMIEGACSKILHSHASTRERMPEIEEFYRTIFSKTGIPSKISDLACAFGPFAFRRMGLPRSVKYHAYDINQRIVDLINVYFGLEDIEPLAAIRDVLCSTPGEQVDVAFLLKMYHCLEHRKRGAGWRVVEAAQANWIVVSFPTKNLRGQFADIVANYESHILSKSVSQAWQCFRLNFASETVLLIDKRSSYEQ
jgi:16S rRNA (guanine(1405)-N(7))-methyltransferase